MNDNNICPCCSNKMLKHLTYNYSYWYCRSCRIEMPIVDQDKVVKNGNSINFYSQSIKPKVDSNTNVKTIATFTK